jgi:hypothetical protein
MKRFTYILAIAAFFTTSLAHSQCRSFVKNNCGEAMGDYVPAENFNAAKLQPGDVAEVEMTFYGGEDYRLLICGHELLGDIAFQLLDTEDNLLFDNAEHEMTQHFDFKVEGTQNLKVKINVSPNTDAALNPQGCVAILVGRKVEG